jgi:MFS family permease
MTTLLRPMSTGELLDRTFFLYRKHFTLFVGIVAVPYLILLALRLAQAALLGKSLIVSTFVVGGVMVVAYLIALAASQSATVVAVSAVHLDKPISIGTAFGAVKGRLLKIIGIMIAMWVGLAVGFLLLIIPGIILSLGWALTIPVAVIENKGLKESTSRSWFLTKGDRGRIFVVAFLFVVLLYIMMILLQGPLLFALGSSRLVMRTTFPGWFLVLNSVATFISECLVGPLLTIALSLIYYDERVKKEGFDLQLMLHSLQGPADNASAVSAS